MLAACAGSDAERPEERAPAPEKVLGERERLAPGVLVGSNQAPRTVLVNEVPAPEGVERVQFFILGFPEDVFTGGELPPGVPPSYFGASPELSVTEWPMRFDAPVPVGVRLLAARDVNGDGRPGPEDRRASVPVVAGDDEEAELSFTIDRGFTPSSGADGLAAGRGVILSPPGATLKDTKVRFSGGPELGSRCDKTLTITGYAQGALAGTGERRPVYFWSSGDLDQAWPVEREVPLPVGLDLIASMDQNQDRVLTNGEWVVPTLKAFDPNLAVSPLALVLSERFSVASTIGDKGSGSGASSGGDKGSAMYRGVVLSPTRGEMTSTEVWFSAAPELGKRCDKALTISGYAKGVLEAGVNRPPVYFWTSGEIDQPWPVKFEVPLPGGLDLIISLDQDGDGLLSDEEWVAPTLKGFVPPSGGAPLRPVLSERFSVRQFTASLGAGDAVKAGLQLWPQDALLQERSIVVLAPPGSTKGLAAGVLVLGFSTTDMDGGAPKKGALPVYVWRKKAEQLAFPLELTLKVAPDLALYTVLDQDNDGRMSGGDLRSEQWDGGGSSRGALETRPAIPVDGNFASSDRQGAPIIEAGSGPPQPRQLVVRIAEPVPSNWSSPVMVVGFPENTLSSGFPTRGGMHRFFWQSPEAVRSWPARFDLELPRDLAYLVVLDRDGDGRPSPGDWASSTLGIGTKTELEVVIAGLFGPDTSEDEEEEDEDDEGDDDSAEDDEPSPEGLVGPVTELGVEQSVQRRLVIDTNPRVPFLRRGNIMVVGFPDSEIERGMPEPDARPSFFWRSEQLSLTWPLRMQARLPRDQTIFVILDLDDNRLPSPGDLSSAARPDYAPPRSGEEEEFLLDKAYSLSTRISRDEDDE
ncbi:MAG: hypothetical protein VX498_16045 [Myxococcota bacterium]|nr:hypothetical protein [Myxococcota bacterium]